MGMAINSSSLLERNMEVDLLETGLPRAPTYKELSVSSLKAMSASTDLTYSEWVSSLSNSTQVRVLLPSASQDLRSSASTGELPSPLTSKSLSPPLAARPSLPRLDLTLSLKLPTSKTEESFVTYSETSTNEHRVFF